MEITFLYFEDCPSHAEALARLRQVVAAEGCAADIEVIKVESEADAERYQFAGSPTIRIAGQDIDPLPPDTRCVLACRAYRHPDGRITPLPPLELIQRALRTVQHVCPDVEASG